MEALAGGSTVTEAAKLAGVGVRTLQRWTAERGDFDAAYRELCDAFSQNMMDRLISLAPVAVTALKGLLTDQKSEVRLRAAMFIIERAEGAKDRWARPQDGPPPSEVIDIEAKRRPGENQAMAAAVFEDVGTAQDRPDLQEPARR